MASVKSDPCNITLSTPLPNISPDFVLKIVKPFLNLSLSVVFSNSPIIPASLIACIEGAICLLAST